MILQRDIMILQREIRPKMFTKSESHFLILRSSQNLRISKSGRLEDLMSNMSDLEMIQNAINITLGTRQGIEIMINCLFNGWMKITKDDLA